MRASSWLLFAALAGCSSSGPSKLVDNAVLAAVSPDEKLLAYYTNYSMMSNHAALGTLSVKPLAGGAPTALGDNAFGAAFTMNGSAMTWSTGPTPSTDANAVNVVYGALSVWTPQTTAAVKLTTGLATYAAEPPDSSFVLYFDGAMPTRAQTGNVVLVRTAECTGTTCKPVMLASNVEVSSMISSLDGRFGAYVVRNGTGAAAMHEAWLVDVAAGTTTKVAASTLANFVALSPDGSLLATGASLMVPGVPVPVPLQLQVFSTSSKALVTWAAQPQGTATVQAAFSDASTLITRVTTAQMMGSIYRSTASAATQLVPTAKLFILQRNTAAAARWLFVTTANATAPYDLSVYDLMAATPTAMTLGTMTSAPTVSNDGTLVRFMENYDVNAETGSLMTAALPAGQPSKVADGVPLGGVAFVSETDKVLYLDALGGMGALTEINGSKSTAIARLVFNYRTRSMPDQKLFFATTGADTVSGTSAPGIYVVANAP
jgi:hypothetical protein